MMKEISYETARYNYFAGNWVCIGTSQEEFWSVNKSHHPKQNLEDIMERYKQYYDGDIKFYVQI